MIGYEEMKTENYNSKLGNPKSKYYLLPFRRSSRRGEARRSPAATPRQAMAQY